MAMSTTQARTGESDRRSRSHDVFAWALDEGLVSRSRNVKAVRRFAKATRRTAKAKRTPYRLLQLQLQRTSMVVTVPQDTGSHTFRGGTIRDCKMVTIGNTSGGSGVHSTPNSLPAPVLPRHTFTQLRVSKSQGVHFGNTGPGSDGHDYTGQKLQNNGCVKCGDFDNAHTKGAHFQTYKHHATPNGRARNI